MKRAVKFLVGLLIVLYPLAVYFGLKYFEAKYLAVCLCLVLLLQHFSGSGLSASVSNKQKIIIATLAAILIVFSFIENSIEGLKLYPVVINFSLLLTFVYSLFYPPTVIERIARLQDPDLDSEAIKYIRLITKLWCVLFVFNGSVALYTSMFSSIEVWVLYNGLIAYFLIGGLLGGELLYRHLYLKKGKRKEA